MNYRTIIAFMGKKQLDKYKPSGASWMLIKDYSAAEWSQEFTSMKNMSEPTDDMLIQCDGYITGNQILIRPKTSAGENFDPTDRYVSSMAFYYNPEQDMYFYLTKEEYDKHVKNDDNLNKIFEFIVEHKNADEMYPLHKVLL